MIRIIDCGSQLTQVIARRIREQHVYAEIVPYYTPLEQVVSGNPDALIISGGPHSVYDRDAPQPPEGVFTLDIPEFGICFGLQSMAHQRAGKVVPATGNREYGGTMIDVVPDSALFRGLPARQLVWMSHGDVVHQMPVGFREVARSNGHIAAMEHHEERKYAVQFHPEVSHTEYGREILQNFLRLAGAKEDWTHEDFITAEVERVRKKVGDAQVIGALSGGVDSTVAGLLLHRAIGERFHPIFVDNGLLRNNEANEVYASITAAGLDLKVVDASAQFLSALKGITNPDQKREIIGAVFIDVFQAVAQNIFAAEYLMQGTLYPDVIESVPVYGVSSRIKRHHNVGGLPEAMKLKLVEPLRNLFKDEVRAVGRQLGLSERIVGRHPFPGPGLGVRIVGEVTPERLKIVRQADAIFIEELRRRGLYERIGQAYAALPGVRTVGVQGDAHTFDEQVQLRAVETDDFMTAAPFEFEPPVIRAISRRITNEVQGVNRVVYDWSEKPPATIELE